MAKKKKLVRREWTKENIKELKAHSKARTPVVKIAKAKTNNKLLIFDSSRRAAGKKSVWPEDGTRTQYGRPCLARTFAPIAMDGATGKLRLLVVSHKGMTIGVLLAMRRDGFRVFFAPFRPEFSDRSYGGNWRTATD